MVTNIDARPTTDGDALRDALVRQVDGSVRWVESVEHSVNRAGLLVCALVLGCSGPEEKRVFRISPSREPPCDATTTPVVPDSS